MFSDRNNSGASLKQRNPTNTCKTGNQGAMIKKISILTIVTVGPEARDLYTLNMRALLCLEMWGTDYPDTQPRIPEERSRHA